MCFLTGGDLNERSLVLLAVSGQVNTHKQVKDHLPEASAGYLWRGPFGEAALRKASGLSRTVHTQLMYSEVRACTTAVTCSSRRLMTVFERSPSVNTQMRKPHGTR